MISGLEKGKLEIKIGKVKILRLLAAIAPGIALKIINKQSKT
jgi:hypothetical protein